MSEECARAMSDEPDGSEPERMGYEDLGPKGLAVSLVILVVSVVLLVFLGWHGAVGTVLSLFACFGGVGALMQAWQIYKKRA